MTTIHGSESAGGGRRSSWVVSLLLVAFALALQAIPGAAEALEYNRTAVEAGEVWRIATSQFVHYPGDHLLWDLGMFALLAPLLEGRRRALLALTVGVTAILVPASLWVGQPQVETFRGLSGVDTAIFGALCVLLFQEMRAHRDRGGLALLAVQVTAFGCKLAYEHITGRCFLVHNEGWSPVTSAHLVGIAVGLGCAIAASAWHRSRSSESPCTSIASLSPSP